MWQIIINGPGYFDTQYELPEGVTHLGRADENDIVLSGDLVSRRHARLRVRGDQLIVEDLGSRNGSRINGLPLHGNAILRPGDLISVGENTLAVRQPSPVETAATEMHEAGATKPTVRDLDIESAVLKARDLRESVVMRALDNVVPFGSGPGASPFDEAERQVNYGWLLALYKIAERLNTAQTLQEFLDDTADRVMERVQATTAVVLLRQASGAMSPATVRHRGQLAKGELPLSEAIVEAALKKGAALAVADVRDDARFSNRESVILYGAAQVLCIPIKSDDQFVGVLYLNRSSQESGDLDHLLDLCTAVANLIRTGIDKFGSAHRVDGHERTRQALERFHAPHIAEKRAAELARSSGKPTGMEERTCTILFADIAGFTQLTQRLPPERVTEILNEFYQRMSGIVFSFEGTVDKFMGDAVMALFGAPYAPGDEALRAVRTAIAMRAEWERAVSQFPAEDRCYLRIGLNTGKVLAGTVGAQARLDYTALGEPVNVASWLTASALPGQVLITGKTLAAVGARFDVTPLGERIIRPPRDRVAVFEVMEEDLAHLTQPGMR
ncbi:MAG: adenylate/guanylate cyclase domain-containing protein [Myxococcaceae bacterium]